MRKQSTTSTTPRCASEADLECLLPLCEKYHAFEKLTLPSSDRQKSLSLLVRTESLGFVLICHHHGVAVAYIAVCFGFSIELGGREAFIDELFVDEEYRGMGFGSSLVKAALEKSRANSVRAMHMEVGRDNASARRFYQRQGFVPRDEYFLMTKLC